jgi:lipopolysaccharide heptosyltransferase I
MTLLVVRLGSLGDLVHTLPAVAAIRRAHPGAIVDWLVDAAHVEFLELVPILSSIVRLPSRSARGWFEARRQLRAKRYDVALDFQGLLKSAALARLSGARRVAGFDRASLRESMAAPLYTERVAIDRDCHVIDKNLRLAAVVGAGLGETTREFPIRDVESAALRSVQSGGVREFALINPAAAWPNKRWPAERFGRLAAWMRERHQLPAVVLWGPGEEALAHDVARAAGGSAIVAPPTRMADLVALARAARLIVSGDTGPLHIAAAVGTPVVALFGPTNPRRNGPWALGDVALSRYAHCDCHYERRCRRQPERWCLASIEDSEVAAAVDGRLGRRERGADAADCDPGTGHRTQGTGNRSS